MKLVYQNKVLESLDATQFRCKLLKNSISGDGKQLSNDEAFKLLNEIEYFIDSSRSIVELIPTE